MEVADRICGLAEGLPESEASRILWLVVRIRGKRATAAHAQRRVDLDLFRQYLGRYGAARIEREALHNRAGLR